MQWYAEDVKAVIHERQSCPYEPKTIFYGSSSIRLWEDLYEDFENFKPVNLGFGGSTLAACVWFFNEIVAPIRHPEKFIFYAGDNDLGDQRHPEEVVIFFRQLLVILRQHYPTIPFYFLSIKPSISRLEILPEIVRTNQLINDEIDKTPGENYFVNLFNSMLGKDGKPIATLFSEDGLHLNRKGYLLWREIVLNECLLY